jgi:hypothetical protein
MSKPSKEELDELARLAESIQQTANEAGLEPPLIAALGAFLIVESVEDMADDFLEVRAEVLRQAIFSIKDKLPDETDYLDALNGEREGPLN